MKSEVATSTMINLNHSIFLSFMHVLGFLEIKADQYRIIITLIIKQNVLSLFEVVTHSS